MDFFFISNSVAPFLDNRVEKQLIEVVKYAIMYVLLNLLDFFSIFVFSFFLKLSVYLTEQKIQKHYYNLHNFLLLTPTLNNDLRFNRRHPH